MGSKPSVVEVPPGHKVVVRTTSTARSGKQTRFEEVEFRPAEGASPSSSRSNRQGSKRNGTGARAKSGGGEGKEGTSAGGKESSSDFHSMVGEMQRQKTTMGDFETPEYGAEDDLVMETFYHSNGTSYQCIYQSGKRFYLDSWQTQDWIEFPEIWYKQGILVTDKVMKNDPADEQHVAAAGGSGITEQSDDREGSLDHPQRGTLPTYMFEELRNIHYYYDKNVGTWVRLPIAWELHHPLIKKLLLPIEEALPGWTDKHDMLAMLRVNNYDPHETINNYMAKGENDSFRAARNTQDAKLLEEKDQRIKELEERVKRLKNKNAKVQKSYEEEKRDGKAQAMHAASLKEQCADLEARLAQSSAQLDSIQRERPKTARPRTAIKQKEPESSVDPATVHALARTTRQLHAAYSKLKRDTHETFEELKAMFRQIGVGLSKISLCESGNSHELSEVRALYQREALQRKLLYNKLQELRGNIRVFARCRYDDREPCCLRFPTDREVMPPGAKKAYKFDKVFTPDSTQEEVFAEACPIITSCVDGYNVCILAYGQTGSGKTFTMQGPDNDPGVNTRSIKELLKVCTGRQNVIYTLTASMVEIYNETIKDLLSKDSNALDIKTQGNKIHLPGLTQRLVENVQDIQGIIDTGNTNRATAETKMNEHSSRSHLILMINVVGEDRTTGAVSTGQLTLCDLAGSERVGKTEATGQRLVEAAAINKSLSSLGQVFTALRQGQLHVPYRNSKLTHILQPCLGGDAKAALFVMCAPGEYNLPETISTLGFGSNARHVALGQAKKNVRPGPGD